MMKTLFGSKVRKTTALSLIVLLMLFISIMQLESVSAQVSWGPEVQLTNDQFVSQTPTIETGPNNNVHVAYVTSGYPQIFYKQYSSSGSIVVPETRVSYSANAAQSPTIAVDSDNNAVICWHEMQEAQFWNWKVLCKKVSGVDGHELASRAIQMNNALFPSVAIDRNNRKVYVVWQDKRGGANQIYMTRLDQNLVVELAPVRLTSILQLYANHPDLAIDSTGKLHVVWQGATVNIYDRIPFYGSYTSNGGQYSGERALTQYQAHFPRLAINPTDSQNTVYITWRYYNEIQYVKYLNGMPIITPLTVSSTSSPTVNAQPDITIDSSNTYAYIVWPGKLMNWQIYFARVSQSTTPFQTVLSSIPAEPPPQIFAFNANVAAGLDGRIHVVWNDGRTGNQEIYKRSTA